MSKPAFVSLLESLILGSPEMKMESSEHYKSPSSSLLYFLSRKTPNLTDKHCKFNLTAETIKRWQLSNPSVSSFSSMGSLCVNSPHSRPRRNRTSLSNSSRPTTALPMAIGTNSPTRRTSMRLCARPGNSADMFTICLPSRVTEVHPTVIPETLQELQSRLGVSEVWASSYVHLGVSIPAVC
ncbi:hypothetical protein BC826DRAFT_518018 [Russula brevipes]|nr:hypothetical protein BC826DRAFT_518018 [Russula brevipes]